MGLDLDLTLELLYQSGFADTRFAGQKYGLSVSMSQNMMVRCRRSPDPKMSLFW